MAIMSAPVPPDAFTLFSEHIQETVPGLVADLQCNQQAMNKRLAQLWHTTSTTHNKTFDSINALEKQIWINYLASLANSPDSGSDSDSDNCAKPGVLSDAQSGSFFFVYVCTVVLGWTQSEAIAEWANIQPAERKIHEMRGKRWNKLSEMHGIFPGRLPSVANVDEFYSYLPVTTYARCGEAGKAFWMVKYANA